MAHTASVGSAKRTVDVAGKRLGIKKFGGQYVKAGEIILRQRGSNFFPGKNTSEGRDFTIYATSEGYVSFRRMTGYKRNQKLVDILPTLINKTVVKKVSQVEVAAEAKPKAVAVKKATPKKTTTAVASAKKSAPKAKKTTVKAKK